MTQYCEVLAPAHAVTGRDESEPRLQRAEVATVTFRILPDLPFTAGFRYLWVLGSVDHQEAS
ncbi:hypothetical protein GCM10009789_12690 [Kribbella sancticallisti]|uniref:Uncharacterized protein n=1 Tax=Kribbella sancticallisti TaxID=460087 RepID=A0ABN2CM47_9ACTN